jgi:methylated-DNA-[protein]-cysteine S-methyltransferase
MTGMEKYFTYEFSGFKPLTIVAEDSAVVAVMWNAPKKSLKPCFEETKLHRDAAKQLREYFAGKRREFILPLELKGTEFQLDCWNALDDIPYGETRSYGDIARAVGRPKAFRAVGMACNRNPIPIIVPCHRVIGSNGSLVGFGGGIERKKFLITLERRYASN